MTVAAELADWALGLRFGELPERVRAAASRHILDALGTAVAAARTGAAAPAVTVAAKLGGPPEATVIGRPGRLGATAAALANGVLIHALDFDDTHAGGLVHATAPVLPAALAVGEQTGASGAEVLTAVVAGMETICRLGAVVPHGFHARGLHATMTCGVPAAALTASRLYGLTPDRTVHAIGIAGSQAGGLLEFLNSGASTKQMHPGFAAHAGVLAARLAAAGATGPATVIEGEYGLFGALIGRPGAGPAALAELGERWEITRITVKPYPVCQLSHAALDAAAKLRPRLPDGTGRIAEIVVEIHPDAAQAVCGPGKDRPPSAYAAKFSMPWCVAALLIDGALTTATFDDLDRPEVTALAGLVRHEPVAFAGAAADQPGRVRARLDDGTWLPAEVPRSGGGPDDPGIGRLVRAKAVANFGGGPAAEDLADLIGELAGLPSAGPLLTTLEKIV